MLTKQTLTRMSIVSGFLFALAFSSCAPAFSQDGGSTPSFSSEVRLGLEAIAQSEWELAVEYFQHAASMEPSNPQGFLYLALAQGQLVIPGVQTNENLKAAQSEIDSLNRVLALQPNDGYAMRLLADVYFNLNQLDKAKEAQLRILSVEPRDFLADYVVGAIDWSLAFKHASVRLQQDRLFPSAGYPKASPAACQAIASANNAILADAIEHLGRAIAADPQDVDSLRYLELVYELRAGTHCGDAAGRAKDLATARSYQEKWIAAKRSNGGTDGPQSPQPPSTLVVPDILKASLLAVIPPPPPPPPPPPSLK